MKKLLLVLSLLVGMMSVASAQVCTPDSAHFTSGVYIYPASLPCITQQAAFTGTVSIKAPDSIDAHLVYSSIPANSYYIHVDSMVVDSISGFPAGITAADYPAFGQWLYGGQYGCSTFTGTTSAAVGTYPLAIKGRACGHGTFPVVGYVDSCMVFNFSSVIPYSVSVCAATPPPICTPDTAAFTNGATVVPATLPCIIPAIAYSHYISIRVPDSIDAHLVVSQLPANTYYLHIDSMRIDSITGMPSGISIETNPGDSVWLHGGQYGCAEVSGTTHAAIGNYPIGVFGRGCVHGSILGFNIDSCVAGSLTSFFNFSLNVCSINGACTIDSSHFSSTVHVYPDSQQCILRGQAFAGQINIQVPATVDAHDFITLFPAGTATIHVDSIDITGITGYPAGISSNSNPVVGSWLYPLSYACAALSGTTTAPVGSYALTISGTACGHGTFPILGTIDTCIHNFNFSQVYPYSLSVCGGVGISEVANGVSMNIYPNPNQGTFTVTVSSDSRMIGMMSVVDQLGRVISTKNIDVTGTQQIPLSLGSTVPGAYMLSITAGDKRSVRQFIVQ